MREVREHMKGILETIRSQTVYADLLDPNTPPIYYREIVGEKGKIKSPVSSNGDLLEDHFKFLREILANPNDGIAKHYDRLGCGREKGNRLLRELKQLGYIIVHETKSTNPLGGRSRLVPSLTPDGKQFLESYEKQRS